ncbi:hypothetical protein DZC30_17280 [Comamonas testosteroni]|uniref:Uncharacterized protein n=1 Tax=Comamonas testosteroni TaxID=285 RepID=A0A373FD37_COMTE|nr:hypothetical protein DZC30_17280 [Comamonas testosteroni]
MSKKSLISVIDPLALDIKNEQMISIDHFVFLIHLRCKRGIYDIRNQKIPSTRDDWRIGWVWRRRQF